MLDDDERRFGFGKSIQCCSVFALEIIRRIEEDDFGLVPRQCEQHRASDHSGSRLEPQGRQVCTDHVERSSIAFQEVRVPRPTAERFNPNGAGAGISIQKGGAFDARRQNVE